jgi:hypothetical protein
VKLTKPQAEELRQLARDRQYTYGRGRSRVQNNLVRMKLACFKDEYGKTVAPSSWGFPSVCDWCEITAAGRALLKEALLAGQHEVLGE